MSCASPQRSDRAGFNRRRGDLDSTRGSRACQLGNLHTSGSIPHLEPYKGLAPLPTYRRTYTGLAHIPRRTWWLIFVEGESIVETAQIRSVARSAIYTRLKNMTRRNEYVALAFCHVRVRPRINQFRDANRFRRHTPVDANVQPGLDTSKTEGGLYAIGPRRRPLGSNTRPAMHPASDHASDKRSPNHGRPERSALWRGASGAGERLTLPPYSDCR
jgi:hypothetical protein